MIRRLLQPNLIRRAVAIAIGGGRYASTGFSRAVGWSPLDLFEGGKKGAWYDPSDLSTMWQDSAGTTPVTADGQPVGKILDKSGNGNHATQPVAGKRPTYHTAGGTHWLDFDGVDDSLYTASINLTSTSKITVFAGTANSKTLSTGTLLEFSANYLNNVGGFAMLTPSLATSHISFGSHGTAAAGEKETQEAPVGLTRPRVLTCAQNFATTDDYGCDYIRANQIPIGNLVGAGNTNVGAGPLGTFPAYIGARNNGANASSGNSLWGRVYSLIFVGEMYDEATLVKAEEWIDAKMVAIYMPIWSRYYNIDPALGANATFTRAGTAYVRDHLGVYNLAAANEARFEGARRVWNQATGITTQTLTVVSGNTYQVTIKGTTGATCVCSNAFTGTLTASGTSRISWASGTPKTSGSTSLVLTVTGALTELQVEDVTSRALKVPSEYVSVGVLSAPYHGAGVDGVKYFDYANGNTVDANGVVTEAQGAAIDQENMYLLMESAATNLLKYSNELANTEWVKDGSSIIINNAIGPDGTQTADRVTASGTVAYVRQTVDNSTGFYTFSAFVKPDTASKCFMYNWAASTWGVAYFDFTDMTTQAVAGSYGSPQNLKIVALSNGWYRVSTSWNLTPQTGGAFGIGPVDAKGSINVTPGKFQYYFGIQLETGEVATSYIPTTSAPVTRAADALAYSGVPADNEMLFTNKLGVETKLNDWNGTVPVPGTYRSIEVYNPGERP